VELTKLYAWLFFGLRITDAAPAEAVRHLDAPLLIIHGGADSQIPLEHSRAIYANADHHISELWIVPEAEHGFAHALEGPRYEMRVKQFFERNLCSLSSSEKNRGDW
jgi:fermentation-respiration switch protein FrsA (DUF1100 family)